ncbi:peptidase U32 family protein [Paenibacillus caseinilyticus]|uniref:Protease n=1 Tax=Paenibacillus mucilaginosus K02 TaxID=997761 RepID=I0BRG6_9BACL|nr:U32 family peptidase [Paenibacillus mucilaginosus]AFH64963.1 protease [Paenibacillus mucilaginosus K02]WFA21107.1 U32 family peptidase [Paenibacillus mucilaginosus]
MTLMREQLLGRRVRFEKPEVLAPAGSLEKLKFAVHYGADAVYIGGQQYGLRSNADNFTFEEMREGVEFAEQYGAKVFVATNIYAHNEDIEGIEAYLKGIQDAGVHAIIVADPVIIETCKRAAPKLEIHLSTQQSTMNAGAVQFWKEEGIDRVVLAREATMEEIREIKENVEMEIEVFVHGAMCSSYSGRCVLSNHFTDRDSNRGGCSQSCRWKYDLFTTEEDTQIGIKEIPLFQEGDNPFSMSSKDLCMIEHVPDLIRAGVDSFKIEGRMKSVHYVATVVNAYRQAIDAYFEDPENYRMNPQWLYEIQKAANRPLNTGFFYDSPGHEDHIFEPEEKAAPYDFVGVVMEYDEATGTALIQQRNHFKPGQEVEFFGPKGTFFKQAVPEIFSQEGDKLDAARHPLQLICMKVDAPVKPLDMMRKKFGK